MPAIALQQVSSTFARENARRSLDSPIALSRLKKYLTPEKYSELEAACPQGSVFIWGAKFERIHQFEKMLPRRCLVLFRRGTKVYKCGVVSSWLVDNELAARLWGLDEDGETWALIYFLSKVHDVNLSVVEINHLLGRSERDNWQGLTAVSSEGATLVIDAVKSHLRNAPN